MSTKKFGIVAGIAMALSVVVSGPVSAACSLTTLSECDNNGLMALVLQLLAGSQTQTTTGTSISGIPAGFTFTTNLKQGSTGNDVKYLQILLNSDAATSIGNKGSETTYFGAMTKAAVVKFQNKYASEVLTPYGLSAGTGFFGSASRTKANTMIATGTTGTGTTGTGTTTTPTSTGFTVSLAADTPAASTLIVGQAVADLAHLSFSNGTSSEVKITNLKLKRLGVSGDATLSKIYLYDGATRLSDEAVVSSGIITWNNTTGVITIPANTVKTIAVRADIAALVGGSAPTGQTIGVGIAAAADITSNATVAGSFPVNGSIHTTAAANLATISFTNSTGTTPATNGSLSPQSNFIMFENTVTVGTRAVNLKSITFRNIGSVAQADLQNLKLLVDGVQVGSTIVSPQSDGYFTFDLSSAPIKLETGGRIIKVVGDVVGGSTKTFMITVYKASDVIATDTEYGVNVLAQNAGASFSPVQAGQQTVATGALSITKRTDSTSGNIAKGASQVTLAKYDLKATGEPIKIENLRVSYDATPGSDAVSANSITELRNGALFVDGVQVGSTMTLLEATDTAYVEFTLGSSLIVTPGTTRVLEVKADIFDNDGTDNIAAGSTLKVNLIVGASNYQQMTSGGYANTPANTDANTLQIALGTLTATVDQSYGSSSIVVPQTNFLLGKFNVTAGSTENVNLNTVRVLFKFGSDDFASDDLTNVYVKYGTESTSALSTIATAAASADSLNTFSISKALTKTQNLVFEVYGDIASTAYADAAATDSVTTYFQVSGVTAQSATTVYSRGGAALTSSNEATNAALGQTITATGGGNLTVTLDNTTPLAAQVVAGATPDAGDLKVKLSAANGDLYVKRIDLRVNSSADSAAISSVALYAAQGSGAYTLVGEQTMNNDGTNPGYVQWILGGDSRIQVLKSGTTYLLAKPTYVSSGQATVSGLVPQLLLADLEVDGSNGVSIIPGFSTLTNDTGIIVKSNSTGVYVASGATTNAANTVNTATATEIVTDNAANFTAGDVIFVGQTGAAYTPTTDELMVVLIDAGANITVQRGAFGTTPHAYDTGKAIYRLDNAGSIRGIIGNAMTVLNTKLALSLGSDSPSGATTGADGKIVFTFNAAAENNASDPAENKATLTRVDITTAKSGVDVSDLRIYPSEYDQNTSYDTVCGALSTTKWRCIMDTTGSANEIIENTSRKYIVRANVGYTAASSTLVVSIAGLGNSNAPTTNDVLWSDDKPTAQGWVNQATSSVIGGSQTSGVSGTDDTSKPTIAAINVANKSGGTVNLTEAGDIITITFSEVIDPTTISTNANFIPGNTTGVTGVLAASTGGVTLGSADGIVTVTNIGTFDLGTNGATATSSTTDLTLDATGKILTIKLNTVTTPSTYTVNALAAGTQVVTIVTDVNGNAAAAVATAAPTTGSTF